MNAILVLMGYLSGSVMYAPLFARLLGRSDRLARSRDGNPGAANAFTCCGFLCGSLTLLCDLGKGLLPVALFVHLAGAQSPWLPVMLAAPVAGHVLPVFCRFRGGKGIAVTFGVLLGLAPDLLPAALLAGFFLLYSLVIRIIPHLQRTLATYLSTVAAMAPAGVSREVLAGFALIAALVCIRLLTSHETKERTRVKLLWMH